MRNWHQENVDDSTDIQRFRPIQKERWKTRKKNIEKIIAQSCVQVCYMRTRRSSYTNYFLQDFSLKKRFWRTTNDFQSQNMWKFSKDSIQLRW